MATQAGTTPALNLSGIASAINDYTPGPFVCFLMAIAAGILAYFLYTQGQNEAAAAAGTAAVLLFAAFEGKKTASASSAKATAQDNAEQIQQTQQLINALIEQLAPKVLCNLKPGEQPQIINGRCSAGSPALEIIPSITEAVSK